MIGTQGEHDPKAAGGLERHEKIDERSALGFSCFGQKLLELIHDQQGFRPADRQIAANGIGGLARIRGVDPLAQGRALVRGRPSRSAASVTPRLNPSIGSRRGRMTTTCHSRSSGSRPAVSESAPPRKAGMSPACASDDLPAPLSATIAISRCCFNMATSSAISSLRPKKRSASASVIALRPTKGLSSTTVFSPDDRRSTARRSFANCSDR